MKALAAALLLTLVACRPAAGPRPGAWERIDLATLRHEVDMSPQGISPDRLAVRVVSFLGAAEVRDMARVPAAQLVAFPRRTAGQVEALEQVAGSRVKWKVALGRDAYLTFTPLGAEVPCPSNYRVGLRPVGGELKELFNAPVVPVAPIAPAAVEISLAKWAGQTVELMLQIDTIAAGGVNPSAADAGEPPAPDAGAPRALWGSPAIYDRDKPAAGRRPARSAHPNVLLIGVDTLRADAVGPWRKGPTLTPSLDRLATASDVWLDAFSTFNVTNPSFISILTGLYGRDHGVYDLQTPLPRAHTTLAELYAKAGYDTLAVISARHLGDHNSGLGQGFARVVEPSEHFAAEYAVEQTMDWLAAREKRADRRPFFTWLHLFDPHTPHTPPNPYAQGMRPAEPFGLGPVPAWIAFRAPGPVAFTEPVLGAARELYDGEVAYLDREVGRLLDFLDSRGLLEDTLVVLVADHGENVGEHGIRFRHVGLFDTTTHVPLMIRWPGEAPKGRRIHGLVQTLDLFPTLLAAADLPIPPQDGKDLRQLTEDGKGRPEVFAEHAGKLGLMVRTDRYKYVLSQGNQRFLPDGAYLYDLTTDPGENVNLVGKGLPAERDLRARIARFLAARRPAPTPGAQALSEEDRKRLESLGYR